jgi:predicted peptidase
MQLHNYTFGFASLFSAFFFDSAASQESPIIRSYFYIGGEYVNTSAGHILQDQMYVEKISPTGGPAKPFLVVFIHGGGQTGTVSYHLASGQQY